MHVPQPITADVIVETHLNQKVNHGGECVLDTGSRHERVSSSYLQRGTKVV